MFIRVWRGFRPTFFSLSVVLILAPSASQASLVAFASFQERFLGNNFKYTSSGHAGFGGSSSLFTTSVDGTTADVIPVTFAYVAATDFTLGLSQSLLGNQSATLKLDLNSGSNVVGFGGFTSQSGHIGSLEIRRLIPYLGHDLLLKAQFTGVYYGRAYGQTSDLSADRSLGDWVNFSSDFIDFSQAQNEHLSLSFSALDPFLGPDQFSGFYAPHSSFGTGSFAGGTPDLAPSSFPAPEPTTLCAALAGIAIGAFVRSRRRCS